MADCVPTPVRGVSIDGPFSGLVPPLGSFLRLAGWLVEPVVLIP